MFKQPGTSSGSIAVTAGANVIPSTSTNVQLNSGTVLHVECIAGSAAGTVTLYDGTSTSGLQLVDLTGVPIGTTQIANLSQGVVFSKGLFIVVSGTGTTAIVHYTLD